MKIDSISMQLPEIVNSSKTGKSDSEDFGNIIKNFIGDVNHSQIHADNVTKDFVNGGDVEIQDVMIAGEKAKTSLELLMEIRNKTIDMYKVLTNIQI